MEPVHVAVSALAALLPITNPIGALATFAGLTEGVDRAAMRRQAVMTGVYVLGILAVFALLGTLVLEGLGIGLPALQIAGGLVVAHSGFGMIVSRETLTDDEKTHGVAKPDVSFSPMALPLIAGPGAIGVVIALTARHPGIANRVSVIIAGVVVAGLVAVLLRFGTPLVDKLGPTGLGALTRIIGFLTLAIGVELVTHGVLAVK
ncbi:MarC family protein [Kribbella sp. NPDC049584]|uniref:MarC family protein n=1 Tax=Kribbella sp. NPDC049584 TaxID=3154833 RepID=UPI003413F72D